MSTRLSRRDFLWGAALGPQLFFGALRSRAAEAAARTLSFQHTHTGESLSLTYYADGGYRADALARLSLFLRDFRTGDVHPIDPALLDLLHELRAATATQAPFQVISGYRSPETNEKLRAQGRSVGKKSLHMEGKAIDVRLADVASERLRDVALRLRRGGVGYYEKNDFVHVDVGRVRRW